MLLRTGLSLTRYIIIKETSLELLPHCCGRCVTLHRAAANHNACRNEDSKNKYRYSYGLSHNHIRIGMMTHK
jgi:hypothetical protein